MINTNNNAYLTWNNSSDRNENDQAPTDLTSINYNTNRNYLMSAVLSSTLGPKIVNQFVWGSSYWNNLIDTDNYSPVTVSVRLSGLRDKRATYRSKRSRRKWQIKDSVKLESGKPWVQIRSRLGR